MSIQASQQTKEVKKSTSTQGRPRSLESKQAILEAAWILLEQSSVRSVSIEAIARKAEVGKATIYRWWPSKAAVIVDAFMAQVDAVLPFPKADNALAALQYQMSRVIEVFQGDVGRIVAQIIAEGQYEPEALDGFRDRFLNRRRDAAREVIIQGIKAGEFLSDLDIDLAMDILYGPIYYRLLVQHLPLDQTFAKILSERAILCLLGE